MSTAAAPAADNALQFCASRMAPGEVDELRDCNALLADVAALRARFAEDGYLLVRGLHDRAQVLQARAEMIAGLVREGHVDPDGRILNAGWHGGMGGGLSEAPSFRPVVEGRPVMDFFTRFLGGPTLTFDFKWLRAVASGGATGAHLDIVYMGRGTPNLFTCWTPFGDYAPEQGVLALLPGAHRSAAWQRVRETYGRMDVDRDRVEGWFSDDPRHLAETYGGRWATTTVRAGDAIIFGMWTPHASTTNTTDRVRLSSDTRYQLASDPVDERWVGKDGRAPIGHTTWNSGPQKPMAEAKQEWGLD